MQQQQWQISLHPSPNEDTGGPNQGTDMEPMAVTMKRHSWSPESSTRTGALPKPSPTGPATRAKPTADGHMLCYCSTLWLGQKT